MNVMCPNCGVEFSEHRETAYRCETCGWLKDVDGQWHTCPEPAKVTEPKPVEPVSVPVPHEPVRKEPDEPNVSDSDRPKSNVRSYLGGLVTVTEIEDETDDEEKDD